MKERSQRSLSWYLARAWYYGAVVTLLAFGLLVTYAGLTLALLFGMMLLPKNGVANLRTWFRPWYERLALENETGSGAEWGLRALIDAVIQPPTLDQCLTVVVVFAFVAFVVWLYYRVRYRFARELLLIEPLLVFDPQMALVRQRLVLERAMFDLTEAMYDDDGKERDLFEAIAALKLLNKLPEPYVKWAHRIRKAGNNAVHPHTEEARQQMRPGNALDLALRNKAHLKKVLAWYRRNARRARLTREEWHEIRHRFRNSSAA